MSNTYAFISAQRPCFSEEVNKGRHETLGVQLMRRGFRITEVDGAYDGVPEKSWMVDLRGDQPPVLYLLDLAKRYGQDSILVIDRDGLGWLHYAPPADPEFIGIFTPTSANPLSLKAYTRMPDGSLWTCEEGL